MKTSNPASPRLTPLQLLWHGRLGLPGEGRAWSPALIALLIYIWTIHSYKAPIGFLAVMAFLGLVLLRGQRMRMPAPVKLMGIFLAWGTIGSLLSSYPELSLERMTDFWKVWLVFFGFFNVLHTPALIRTFLIAYLGIYGLYPVRGILYNIVTGNHHEGRYAWNYVWMNPNDYATLTIMILGLTLVALQSARKGWQRAAAAIGVVVLPICILFTQSRAGFLGLALFGALLLFRSRPNPRILALLALVVGLVVLVAPARIWQRISAMREMRPERAGATEWEASTHNRFTIWKVAVALTADHPLLGVGIGAYQKAHAAKALQDQVWANVRGEWATHSTWLNIMAETGIPGLVLYLAMIWSVVRHLARARRRIPTHLAEWRANIRYLEIGLAGYLVCASFGVYATLPFMYLYLGLSWLIADALVRESARREEPLAKSSSAPVTHVLPA